MGNVIYHSALAALGGSAMSVRSKGHCQLMGYIDGGVMDNVQWTVVGAV